MTLNMGDLLSHAVESLRAPREQARWVMSFDLPRNTAWESLGIVVLLSTLLSFGVAQFAPPQEPAIWDPILQSPYMLAIVQMSGLVITVFMVFWVGRAGGGQGRFGDCITVIAWIQFVLFCIQVLQAVAVFVLPSLANLIGVGALILLFWLMTNFIAEVHGFKSLTKVFAMIMGTLFIFFLGLRLILTIIAITAP